ncbi:MAG TPA: hypothetical protein VIV40_10925 [Kofleriaceae bacterium]
MQLAERWIGSGSLVGGAACAIGLAVALSISVYGSAPERLSYADQHWREYTWLGYQSCAPGDAQEISSRAAIESCLSANGGWIALTDDRDGLSVVVEEGTALASCLQHKRDAWEMLCGDWPNNAIDPGVVRQRRPTALVLHQADPWVWRVDAP